MDNEIKPTASHGDIVTVKGYENRVFTVEEFTVEHGGVWRVSTLSSHCVFDLDEMTVTQHPGPTAGSTVHDTARRLATIVRCAVGSGGC